MSDPFSSPPPPPPYNNSGSFSASVVPCGNGTRLWATVLDGLLFIVTCGIGWLIWDIVLWQQSTSPAKKMLNLKIVDLNTGAPASMQQMLLREVLGKIILSTVTSGVSTLIGAVLILVVPSRQGVWDYISKTTVAREG
ncbi:MAG: RDD family protein [Ilumatobacteraceae bacterium]|nr:RDD family protein [Ilumatobacteraceae bacterium]